LPQKAKNDEVVTTLTQTRPRSTETLAATITADSDDDSDFDELPEDLLDEEREEQQQLRLRTRHKSRRHDAGSDAGLEQILAQSDGLEELITTYQPSRHERGWLLSSLRDFYDQGLISDVLASVKGGKEASVYRCRTKETALEAVGSELVAAKVYRPRQLRNLRNDALYREGRPVLTADGQAVKRTDTRIMRALSKKTGFGMQVQHTSWLMYEFTTLDRLYRAGAAVPRPVGASENAILMGYCGDENAAAPTLIETTLEPDEARHLFAEVRRNLRILLSLDMIHGDLSAYNILYWQGKITLIDFPQVVSRDGNPHAETIFRRDVQRVCDYFQHMGVPCDPERIADELWHE
jgi:RIO kinase 1